MAYKGTEVTISTNTITPETLKEFNWQEELFIANLLVERDNTLTLSDYRLLLSAIRSGLPVVQKRLKVIEYREVIETTTVIVERIHITENGMANRIRTKQWGMSNDVYLSEIHSLDTPEYLINPR